MSIVLLGSTSGSITLAEPAVAGSNTLSLPAVTATLATDVNGTLYPLTSGTAVASTSGTSIDFTGIPSWVKRITVMFSDVSTNGTALIRLQLGDSGGIETTGYTGAASYIGNGSGGGSSTAGFDSFDDNSAANSRSGFLVFSNISSNTWVLTGSYLYTAGRQVIFNGTKTLSATLDRIRITTVNGTDTFDAGTINILYE